MPEQSTRSRAERNPVAAAIVCVMAGLVSASLATGVLTGAPPWLLRVAQLGVFVAVVAFAYRRLDRR